jgi:hypothetical protein
MAEGKPRRPDAGAQLEELNDQLARFLQHADQLLEDWARFGAQVRATVDAEIGRVEQGVAEAGERATRDLAAQVDKVAVARVEKAIGDGLQRLRVELDRAGRATAVTPPAAATPDRRLLAGVIAANLLLVLVLTVVWLRGGAGGPPAAASIDAGVAGPSAAVVDACATLAAGWDDDAAEAVWRAGADACGDRAAVVGARLREHLVPPPALDAGVDAAPPVDARPLRRNPR